MRLLKALLVVLAVSLASSSVPIIIMPPRPLTSPGSASAKPGYML